MCALVEGRLRAKLRTQRRAAHRRQDTRSWRALARACKGSLEPVGTVKLLFMGQGVAAAAAEARLLLELEPRGRVRTSRQRCS